MVDAPGVDPPKTGTPRPPEEGGAASPVKKRRGRPRKCDTIAAAAAAAAASPQLGTNGGVGPTPARKVRKRKIDPLSPPQVDASLVGQSVHGVLDGSFDAGYILTVRVGETDTILRGVVFGPGLCVPITTANDIAPNVRFAGGSRGGAAATARLSSPVPASSTTPSSSQAVVMPPALAENPLDVSSSRHHTPVRDHGQQLGFAPVVPPLFGVQTPTAGFIEAGKSCLVEQQQQQQQPLPVELGCSLQLANGSSPQREQQQRTLAEASIEDMDRA
ncbi:uncharacterized protein LOC112346370 [Selaginella moellendorffii]|uniref:uncharacterized protein LOC112346370 n=1 Tax=Selaginella moellendorffii TaxID=88036 RepID=UPI000D1C677E|nr:uncharacterized protein LOC112346370 [Selaginella moellendorffii]|eukprot:XP_024530947.1 uncharacterized protein LOC112346370 [Selaginella moellendorffii]